MFYLESWLHQIVGSVLQKHSVARPDIDEYHLRRVRQSLEYCYGKSSFYREHFRNAGVVPEDLCSIADLARFPFTEPWHLCEMPYRLLCISQAEVARPHSFITSGTTGPQKQVFWTQGDLERIIEFMAAGIATVASPEDVVQILLADGRPYSQADLLYRGVKRIGATPVISGMNASPEEQLRVLDDSRSTILFGYTGQIFRLSKELQRRTDLGRKGVKVLFLAGEYLPDAMRRELEFIWRCRVHTHYGLTEMGLGVAVECGAHAGYHFNEAALLAEIVDPDSGKALPPGAEGELVFTSLTREAMPLIRYRTHDISRLIPEPCPCGAASLLRIDYIRKRVESIVNISPGQELYPSLLDDALYAVPGLIDYQAVWVQRDTGGRLELSVEMQRTDPAALREIRSQLLSIPAIERAVATGNMVEPEPMFAKPGSPGSAGRAKKLIRAHS